MVRPEQQAVVTTGVMMVFQRATVAIVMSPRWNFRIVEPVATWVHHLAAPAFNATAHGEDAGIQAGENAES